MRIITLNKEDIYKGYLLLVNSDYPIRDNECIHSRKLISVDTMYKDIVLESRAATLLSQLLKEIGSNDAIVPVSGYRNRTEQERIYNDSLLKNGSEFTEKYVAMPDKSEHQTGLAIDLAQNTKEIDFIRPNFPYTGICGDFRRKAARYGFIERYQEDKESITLISHEPWHFRYLGYPHSQIIQDNNLSLEEYIHFIKNYPFNGKYFHISENSKEVEVFYVSANTNKTTFELSDNEYFQISGNNVDGFIVTIWRG